MSSSIDVQWMVANEFRPPREGEEDYSALLITFTKRCRSLVLGGLQQNSWQQVTGQHADLHHLPSALPAKAIGVSVHGTKANDACSYVNDTLHAQLQHFRQRFPIDEEAMHYLLMSSGEVQQQVICDFRPPREGEGDYSALLISFTKRCRTAAAMPERTGTSMWMPAHSQLHVPQSQAPPPPPAPFFALQVPEAPDSLSRVYVDAEMDAFRQRFPMDEQAASYLMTSSPDVRTSVLRNFRPPREGDSDYSALLIAFTKRCRLAVPSRTRQTEQKFMPIVWTCSGEVPRGGTLSDAGSFCRRYPIDHRALEYLKESPPDIVARVVREFRPKREGEADYSAAVVAFIGLCRKSAGVEVGSLASKKRMRLA